MMKSLKNEFKSVDEYISAIQNIQRKTIIEKVRQTIRKAAPAAEEVISYQMPGYKFHGMLVWFSASKEHYGFYPTAKPILVFKDKLKDYEISKGTIRFPYEKPVPVKLITEIVKYKVKENLEKNSKRDAKIKK